MAFAVSIPLPPGVSFHFPPAGNGEETMRSVAAYVTAGILAVLAMDMAAPAGVFGARVRAWPALEKGVAVQTVDRTKKGDRLRAPTADSKQPVPKKAPTGVVGCDPAVSPLSAGARTDFPGRCLT